MYKVHEIWPTPIYTNNIGVEQQDIDFVKNQKFERMASGNGSYTETKKLLDKMPSLKEKIEKEIKLYTRDYLKISKELEFYITVSWANKHVPGDWAHIHNHINSLFSGSYYLQTVENSGHFVLKRQGINNICNSTIMYDYDDTTNTNCDSYDFIPKAGAIILFPSHVRHAVGINESEIDRYSIAFNVFAKGNLGIKESELKLC